MATTISDYNRIAVEPLTGSIGAEVSGVDLREVDDEIIAELRDAWLAHKVLFFRDQDLTQQQHVDYGRAFGELEIHPFVGAADDHPEIIVLESHPDAFVSASYWHSDVTFRPNPPLGSILMGREIPPHGGDTIWANMELAYELLPDEIKEQIDGLTAEHTLIKTFGPDLSEAERAVELEKHPNQHHPVVRTHPETGAKSLYVNRPFTLKLDLDGASDEEERALRHRLYDQARIPEIQCRFRWQPGSIAQWDNRCTQHYAVPDYAGFSRRVERVTLAGDRPV